MHLLHQVCAFHYQTNYLSHYCTKDFCTSFNLAIRHVTLFYPGIHISIQSHILTLPTYITHIHVQILSTKCPVVFYNLTSIAWQCINPVFKYFPKIKSYKTLHQKWRSCLPTLYFQEGTQIEHTFSQIVS